MEANEIYLFTNRNWMVFDAQGNQMPEYQGAINCYGINDAALAERAISEAKLFYVCKWKDWEEEVTKREMQYLLGLRTREMDLEDQKGAHRG